MGWDFGCDIVDQRPARIVELRFFGDLEIKEMAEAKVARAWLMVELEQEKPVYM